MFAVVETAARLRRLAELQPVPPSKIPHSLDTPPGGQAHQTHPQGHRVGG
jgi:hypothetical protein